MMKKLLLMAFAVLGLAANAMADDGLSVYVVTAEGDTASSATVATIDYVTFANDSAYVVTTDADTLYKAPIAKIDYMVFGAAQPTAIKSLPAVGAPDKVIISTEGASLNISGIKAGTAIAVYDANGRLAAQTKATGDTVSLDATSLKAGLYIVRAGNKAAKILKK